MVRLSRRLCGSLKIKYILSFTSLKYFMQNKNMNNLKRFEKIVNEAIKRGGLTVGLGQNDYLKIKDFAAGYMVGGFTYEYKVDLQDTTRMDALRLYMMMISLHKQAALEAGFNAWDYTKGLYLGFWVDNGYLYMDISKKFTSKKAAMAEAAKREQLAIYDLKNNESIYL